MNPRILMFNVESGSLVLSDPCYGRETRGYHEVDALNGQWMAEVRYIDAGDWGIRVQELFAVHIDYEVSYDDCEVDYVDDLGVDSGQMCIWDRDDYTNDDDRYEAIGYGDLGDESDGTLSKHQSYRGDCGVACSSGYGDGVYEAECFFEDGPDSPVVAVAIRFI